VKSKFLKNTLPMLFSMQQKKKSNICFIYFNQNGKMKRIKNKIFKKDRVGHEIKRAK